MASFSVDTSVLEATAKDADLVAESVEGSAIDAYFGFLDSFLPGSATAGNEDAIGKRVFTINKRVAEAARAYGTHMRATKANYEEAEKANIAPWSGN